MYTVDKNFRYDKLLCKSLQRGEGLYLSVKTINYGDLSIQAVLSEKTSKLWLQVMTGHNNLPGFDYTSVSLHNCESHIRKGYGLPTCTWVMVLAKKNMMGTRWNSTIVHKGSQHGYVNDRGQLGWDHWMLWVSIRSTNSKVCLQPGFNLSPNNSLWTLFSIHLKKKKKKKKKKILI